MTGMAVELFVAGLLVEVCVGSTSLWQGVLTEPDDDHEWRLA